MNPGDRIGPFIVIGFIGGGAMGEVYLAENGTTGQQVALKIIHRVSGPEYQDILEAERLGAELQRRLAAVDTRVTGVYSYGELAGRLYIEMEFVDGEDLSTLVARGPVHPHFAAGVVTELCDMLQNLRTFTTEIDGRQFAGVIHGDLKPPNIRVDARSRVKVLDFGIAKALSKTRHATTNVFASAAYSSPERLETQHIDTQSDLWSVGVLMYEMLAGRRPFEAESRERLERRIRSRVPPDPLPAGCPEPLSRIVFKMLAGNPAQRYPDPGEVRDDLLRYRNGQPVLARVFEPDATERTTAPLANEVDATVRTAPPAATAASGASRHVRQYRPQAGCFVAIGVALLLFAAFVWWQMDFSSKASILKTDLKAERVSNLDDAWTRYEALSSRSHLPFLLWSTRRAMKERLLNAADSVIEEYRDHDAPAVREAQWQFARKQLGRAMELDPDDREVKGRVRLCDGHLQRINASRLKGLARQKTLNAAVANFTEAAELLKKSPDPYLGLARLYVYELNDVGRAEQALKKADDYGHPMGRREWSQLADGYRRRAEQIVKESRGFAQVPDSEREYLEKARDDYDRAQELYEKTGPFGDSTRNQLLTIQGRQRVDQRLAELSGAAQAPAPEGAPVQ